MLEIQNKDLFGKIIADALKAVDANSTLKTWEKTRWINAIAKGVVLSETQPEFIEYHPELDMLTVWNTETNGVYNANGKCECESGKRGNPCKHQALKRLVKNYLEAVKNPLPKAKESCSCKFNWEDKFTEKFCAKHGAEMEAEVAESASYHDVPYFSGGFSKDRKVEKVGNIRI